MGFINLGSSIKYGPHGKKRKTKAFSTKSKRTKYNELLETQQSQLSIEKNILNNNAISV